VTSVPEPRMSAATSADAGRSCPYCRFPIKEGAQVAACGVCNAPHHLECWQENSGCAVVACGGGPNAAGERPTVVVPPQASYAQSPAPSWVPPPQRSRGVNGWLIAAVVVLALAAGGGITAFLVQRQAAPPPAAQGATVTNVTTVTTQSAPPVTPTIASSVEPWGGESRAQMTSEIQSLLYNQHVAIVNRDFAAAWAMLSRRKQAQNRVKYGYATWEKNQATLSPYLDPSGLQVEILKLDWPRREVTVDVTGMGWSAPGAHCSEWSGVTWVVWQSGQWKYEPGYSTTPEREALWKPRYSELLGTQC
jgi:hypothetical protein